MNMSFIFSSSKDECYLGVIFRSNCEIGEVIRSLITITDSVSKV